MTVWCWFSVVTHCRAPRVYRGFQSLKACLSTRWPWHISRTTSVSTPCWRVYRSTSNISYTSTSRAYDYLFTFSFLLCAFSALTLLGGRQEEHRACKNIEWWAVVVVICLKRGADCLHMVQLMSLPYRLLPHLNPDWFCFSATGLPRLFCKRDR